jgi:hypothetical protein
MAQTLDPSNCGIARFRLSRRSCSEGGWRGSLEGQSPGRPVRPQNHRLPKSNHNHFRFGRAAICKESSNSSLPPRAISSVAVCLFTRVQTIPQSRQRNAGDFNSTFGPNVPQKPRCCGGNSNRHGPSNASSLPSATFWLLQAGHRISISVSNQSNELSDRRAVNLARKVDVQIVHNRRPQSFWAVRCTSLDLDLNNLQSSITG